MASEGTQDGNHVPDITYKAPLVVCITRLVPQKGLHLISHAIKHIEELVSITLRVKHGGNKDTCDMGYRPLLFLFSFFEKKNGYLLYCIITNFYVASLSFCTVI